ncbi:MAG TPA: hypothetical protein VFW93_03730 [Aquabacterium sp.]|uniref:hypothetical protein n=1 Tax=Aquabacterium sp. TaxID=1872578 RepID=UPI002E3269D4|nr:hypothetical protein [Aquabacterium sp.]HEX5355302.1 hypothetical protein [Aquabacterium sp.]
MNTSSAASRTTPAFKMPRRGWMAVMAVFSATAVTTLLLALSNGNDSDTAMASHGTSRQRPLFAGWIKPGTTEFGQEQVNTGAISTQPRWVLATEPSTDEVKGLQSALAEHPDKARELDRLIDYSRFQKQVALWNELQNGPMNSERATLSQHLLEVLPAHYSRGELIGPQALLMAQALVKDLETNPQRQDARLADTRSQLARQAPTIEQDQLTAQKTFESFEQQQQRIMNEQKGTHQPLEARLDVARHALLDGSTNTKTP